MGAGRFGRVYRAWDARLERFVALKILDAAAPTPKATSPLRSIDEARLLARVRHPNVLTVHGAECLEGQVGIWTEYIEGRTLEDLLAARGPFPPDEVVSIGVDLCRALAAVHGAGLLHRDVKAQNIMRETGGRIVLMDFGTGHDLELLPARAGDLSGTPLYLAPELFQGAPARPASDVYALAVVLFRLLSGAYPVPGKTLDDVRRAHQDGRTPDLRSAAPEAPRQLVAAIEQGLATDPAARFGDLTSFESAIAAARPSSTTSGTGGGVRRPFRRSVLIAAAVALAIGLTAWTLDLGGLRHRWLDRSAAGLLSKPLPPRIRMPVPILGQPSRDGRFYPYVDRHGDVQVWEVVTGTSRRITVASAGESGADAVMSADGSRVAYEWLLPDHAYELRMINADGTWPAVLVTRETAFEPVPVDWSRDGRNLLCWFQQRNGGWDLVLVPTAGGPPKIIRTFAKPQPAPASLSPDARYVVHFTPATGGAAPKRQLELLSTDQAASSVTLDAQPFDAFPMWAPARNEVLFFRRPKQDGPADAWVAPVSRGAWAGTPSLASKSVLPPRLSVPFFNVLDDGRLQQQWSMPSSDVYVASITPDGTVGAPTRVSPTHIGEHGSPEWSPDGQSIAYLRRPGGMETRILTIRDPQGHGVVRLQSWASDVLGILYTTAPSWQTDAVGHLWRTDPQGQTKQDMGLAVVGNTVNRMSVTRDGRRLLYTEALSFQELRTSPSPIVTWTRPGR